MVSIAVSGKITSEIRSKIKTCSKGVDQARFSVESKDGDRSTFPLRFECICFGALAERAVTFLKLGVPVNLFGRMSASGDSKQVTVKVLAFEIQGEALTNVDKESD